MQEFLIVGMDVSKSSLDISFKPSGVSMRINNNLAGFKEWFVELTSQCSKGNKVLVVMEHTGQYSYRLEKFLLSKQLAFCKVPALQIKRSLGVTRGKNDHIDADRIASYGWLRREMLKADQNTDDRFRELKSLLGLRFKLVRDRSGYISRLKEMIASGICTSSGYEAKVQQQTIDFLKKQILKVESQIKVLIRSSSDFMNNCDLLMSIKGVGFIIAAYMMACTDNFKKFANARKFNCYAGLAPFEHMSGVSLKGRSRVSHLANKEAKTLLTMAAACAIRTDKELKGYYQKRVSEGMKKMSCLNIIRSKIVARMFAVVKRQSAYRELEIAA
jgi:transposase